MSAPAQAVIGAAAPGDASRERATIALVGLAHGSSHFFHLTLAPLFPWLKDAFALSYAELGLLVTVFFVVSAVGQALSGFLVDRVGAWPVMMAALATFVLAALVLAGASGYAGLMAGAVLCGVGNAPFHPVDYSILNARVGPTRLGKAYAVHGVSGSLGWAAAPALLAGTAQWLGWRTAFVCAALVALAVLAAVWRWRVLMQGVGGVSRAADPQPVGGAAPGAAPAIADASSAGPLRPASGALDGTFAFLRLPAVWMSFGFFFAWSAALGGVLTFGPEAARQLHALPVGWVASCVTVFMLGSAAGMLAGGMLLTRPERAPQVVAVSLGVSALLALLVGLTDWPAWTVPVLFALMGLGMGLAGPSRDLLVKRATPAGATGRVYGMVYSGLDIGMSLSPSLFGLMMDAGRFGLVWAGIAAFQLLLIGSALNIGHLTGRAAPRAA
jgi:MFS family permease